MKINGGSKGRDQEKQGRGDGSRAEIKKNKEGGRDQGQREKASRKYERYHEQKCRIKGSQNQGQPKSRDN